MNARVPLLAGAFALALLGCVDPMPPGPTTTASTSTTASTTSTTINPACGDYTPSGVGLSTGAASAGDTITVSGNGTEGTDVVLTLRKVSDSTEEDPGVTATVGVGGTWSTSLTLPLSLTAGDWDVVAVADGCTAEATALIEIL